MSGQPRNVSSGVSPTWDLTVARQLVGCAARNAPPGLAQRLEEEWLADLAARQGSFARIRFGLGCCWATRVIAREFGAAAATAGGAVSGQQILLARGAFDFSRISRRTVAMVAIVCLHVAVFYAYLTGLAQRIITPPAERIHVVMTPRISKLQPPPPPKLAPSIDPLPTSLVPLDLPLVPTVITVPRLPRPNIVSRRPPVAQSVARVIGGPGAGFPDTADYYPPAARRLGEVGNTVVSVCVDPRGRLTAAPTLVDSSGIRRIDEGALRLATAGSGHYRATTENGRPVSSCYAFRVRFQLEDR